MSKSPFYNHRFQPSYEQVAAWHEQTLTPDQFEKALNDFVGIPHSPRKIQDAKRLAMFAKNSNLIFYIHSMYPAPGYKANPDWKPIKQPGWDPDEDKMTQKEKDQFEYKKRKQMIKFEDYLLDMKFKTVKGSNKI
jgi:hypothetical protein